MSVSIRFLLDENIASHDLIALCDAFDLNVARVHELELTRTDDDIIFEYAMEHNTIIVTANVRDFRKQHADWIKAGKSSPGIVLLQSTRHRNIFDIVETLLRVVNSYVPDLEWWVESED